MKDIYFLLILIILISLFLVSKKYVEPFSGSHTSTSQLYSDAASNHSSNTTSNKNYNSNNYDITYHADATIDNSMSTNNLEFGYIWVKDASGNLNKAKMDVIENKTLYYPYGSDKPNPPPFIPNYEQSVLLSKFSPRNNTITNVENIPFNNNSISSVDTPFNMQK
jgi:hypothetical protein